MTTSTVGSYRSTNLPDMNWTVSADLPTPPGLLKFRLKLVINEIHKIYEI